MPFPETERKIRRAAADIDSLYELGSAMNLKIDGLQRDVTALSQRVDAGFVQMQTVLEQVLDRLGS